MEFRLSFEDGQGLSITDSLTDENFNLDRIQFGSASVLVTVGETIKIDNQLYEIIRIGVGQTRKDLQTLIQVKQLD